MNYSDLQSFGRLGLEYGFVYHKAFHWPTNQVYVLESFISECISGNGPEIRQQIEIFRHVDHPNVMKFVDSFDLGYDRIELLLEFFDGKPLDQSCITDKQILSKIAKQILRGLSYLHKRRIAHKGIKPLSLFMDSRHKVKITGFVASNIEGSVPYMSPDYLSGK
ncbi:mitogen-activated protein kinase kinase 5-like [Pistacia vera]|uniref:mitogen-activated protein kinase kinase 5-like n=1 Tax=Pistacia vera TaxID=55513 RepID=UPI001262D52D|nr:mitogen-activated protein kinase kinase 5-like [Pistacia vera]